MCHAATSQDTSQIFNALEEQADEQGLFDALDKLREHQGTRLEAQCVEDVLKVHSFHEHWVAFINRMPKVMNNAGASRW